MSGVLSGFAGFCFLLLLKFGEVLSGGAGGVGGGGGGDWEAGGA